MGLPEQGKVMGLFYVGILTRHGRLRIGGRSSL